MLIKEVDAGLTPKPTTLLGLVDFLAGRAEDSAAPKEISQDAFMKLAQSLGITLTKNNLATIVGQPPLSNLLEPLDPGSNEPIKFKSGEVEAPGMPVNQAQNVVAAAAKSAMNKDRGL